MDLLKIRGHMELALAEAAKCGADVPVGAIILKGGEVIASGFNQRETLKDPLGHAELIAIRAASEKLSSWRLNGCTLVCTLEPCPMCAEAVIQTRIDTLIFGAYDPISGAAGSVFNLFAKRRSLPTPELIAGILEDECSTLLKQFFVLQRQKRN